MWAETLYTPKCMDFQMKTHFGPLHHGPKAHFYQIFHPKTAKTKSIHNWGKKKKRSYKWKYYEVLAKNSTLSISGLFWTTLNSVNFVLFKIWKGFLNKCNFKLILQTKKDSNLQLRYVRIQTELPNLPVFITRRSPVAQALQFSLLYVVAVFTMPKMGFWAISSPTSVECSNY